MSTNENETVEQAQGRHIAAMHGMQSGVAAKMNFDPNETAPKHLRVGVNSAMVQHAALTRLLIDKGLITEQEYFTAQADMMERERDGYQQEVSQHYGTSVTLR